jgi:hypothetical protein
MTETKLGIEMKRVAMSSEYLEPVFCMMSDATV